jgi:nitrate reductase beta subunit
MGVMLYDADKISDAAGASREQDLYQEQMNIYMDPNDPEVVRQALADGVPQSWIDAAQQSPVYKMAVDWKIAFPIHPEYRTLPSMWYVPPLSPVQGQIDQGTLQTESDGVIPTVNSLRFPSKFLANLLTAGDETPVISAIRRLLAMRSHQRMKTVEGGDGKDALDTAGLTIEQAEEMYRYLGIANYEDRFVIPTSHEELRLDDPYGFQGQNGFSGGNTSAHGEDSGQGMSLFPVPRKKTVTPMAIVAPPKSRRS